MSQRKIDMTTAMIEEDGSRVMWHWVLGEPFFDESATLIRGIGSDTVYVPDSGYGAPARNVGHGHIFPRPDGYKMGARADDCSECKADLALLRAGKAPV
jgi:hypothetical protein